MHAVFPAVATLAVSTIYLLWQNYQAALHRQERVMRDRVAFMLWTAAQQGD